MNPAIYCLLNANWKGHHCKCKGDPRWPAGIIRCCSGFGGLCDLKREHFQVILHLYLSDSQVNLLTSLLWICKEGGGWLPLRDFEQMTFFILPKEEGTGDAKPDPKSCLDKVRWEHGPFRGNPLLLSFCFLFCFLFFLRKLSSSLNLHLKMLKTCS